MRPMMFTSVQLIAQSKYTSNKDQLYIKFGSIIATNTNFDIFGFFIADVRGEY